MLPRRDHVLPRRRLLLAIPRRVKYIQVIRFVRRRTKAIRENFVTTAARTALIVIESRAADLFRYMFLVYTAARRLGIRDGNTPAGIINKPVFKTTYFLGRAPIW